VLALNVHGYESMTTTKTFTKAATYESFSAAPAAAAWKTCRNGSWMLRKAAEIGIDRRLVVQAAAACARLALPHVPKGESRPLKAIEAAEAWCRNEAILEEVEEAANAAAYAAGDAAYAAAYAARTAYAAANTADAARAAANAADAARAATHAAYAAANVANAAAYAARAANAAYAAANAAYAATYAADATVNAAARILNECAKITRNLIPASLVAEKG
jgi:hypothetical protein